VKRKFFKILLSVYGDLLFVNYECAEYSKKIMNGYMFPGQLHGGISKLLKIIFLSDWFLIKTRKPVIYGI